MQHLTDTSNHDGVLTSEWHEGDSDFALTLSGQALKLLRFSTAQNCYRDPLQLFWLQQACCYCLRL